MVESSEANKAERAPVVIGLCDGLCERVFTLIVRSGRTPHVADLCQKRRHQAVLGALWPWWAINCGTR